MSDNKFAIKGVAIHTNEGYIGLHDQSFNIQLEAHQ